MFLILNLVLLPGYQPKDLDTYVKFEFPFPNVSFSMLFAKYFVIFFFWGGIVQIQVTSCTALAA